MLRLGERRGESRATSSCCWEGRQKIIRKCSFLLLGSFRTSHLHRMVDLCIGQEWLVRRWKANERESSSSQLPRSCWVPWGGRRCRKGMGTGVMPAMWLTVFLLEQLQHEQLGARGLHKAEAKRNFAFSWPSSTRLFFWVIKVVMIWQAKQKASDLYWAWEKVPRCCKGPDVGQAI